MVMVYKDTLTGCWVQYWQLFAVRLYASVLHSLFLIVSWMLQTHLLRDSWALQTIQGYLWCHVWMDITILFLWSRWATELRLVVWHWGTESIFSHNFLWLLYFSCILPHAVYKIPNLIGSNKTLFVPDWIFILEASVKWFLCDLNWLVKFL